MYGGSVIQATRQDIFPATYLHFINKTIYLCVALVFVLLAAAAGGAGAGVRSSPVPGGVELYWDGGG